MSCICRSRLVTQRSVDCTEIGSLSSEEKALVFVGIQSGLCSPALGSHDADALFKTRVRFL